MSDAADYDNDGRLDLYATHFASDYSTLYRNLGGLLFEDVTARARIREPEWPLVKWGTRFVDLDHDGWKDIVHANGHVYPHLRAATGRRDLRAAGAHDLPQQPGRDLPRRARGEAGPDATKRGARAAAPPSPTSTTTGTSTWWWPASTRSRSCCATTARPATGSCSGPWGARSNRDGIGARVTVRTGALSQVWEIKRTVGDLLGERPAGALRPRRGARRPTCVRVEWPSGKVDEFRDVPADRHYLVDEEEGLSPEPLRGR